MGNSRSSYNQNQISAEDVKRATENYMKNQDKTSLFGSADEPNPKEPSFQLPQENERRDTRLGGNIALNEASMNMNMSRDTVSSHPFVSNSSLNVTQNDVNNMVMSKDSGAMIISKDSDGF